MIMTAIKCTICNSSDVKFYHSLYDDRYGFPQKNSLFECQQCRHKFLHAEFDSFSLGKLYTDYYPRSSFDLDKYKPSPEVKGLLSWLNGEKRAAYSWVPKNVRILDIGCGLGETLGYHTIRGCDAYGVEADKNIHRVINKLGYKIHVGLFNPDFYEPNFFDYITLDQVIEHVKDPLETMRGIAKILKPGGIAILSTPNASGWGARLFRRHWINWHAPYHLQFFSLYSMSIAAKQAGLTIEKLKIITSSHWLYWQWLHLLFYPNWGQPSRFWSFPKDLKFLEKLLLQTSYIIHRYTMVNHLITRLMDLLKVGDNYLFFLQKKK